MQIKSTPEAHDVVVIGSGAAGGMAAWNLTRQGVNVLVLDAGEKFDRSKYLDAREAVGSRGRASLAARLPPQFYVDGNEPPYTPERRPLFRTDRACGGAAGKPMSGDAWLCATPI